MEAAEKVECFISPENLIIEMIPDFVLFGIIFQFSRGCFCQNVLSEALFCLFLLNFYDSVQVCDKECHCCL